MEKQLQRNLASSGTTTQPHVFPAFFCVSTWYDYKLSWPHPHLLLPPWTGFAGLTSTSGVDRRYGILPGPGVGIPQDPAMDDTMQIMASPETSGTCSNIPIEKRSSLSGRGSTDNAISPDKTMGSSQARAGHGTDMLIPANTWPRVDSLDNTGGGPAREGRKLNAAQRRSLQQLYLLEPTARFPLQLYVHGLPFLGTLLLSTCLSSKHYPCNCQVPNSTGLGPGTGSRSLGDVGQDTQLVQLVLA